MWAFGPKCFFRKLLTCHIYFARCDARIQRRPGKRGKISFIVPRKREVWALWMKRSASLSQCMFKVWGDEAVYQLFCDNLREGNRPLKIRKLVKSKFHLKSDQTWINTNNNQILITKPKITKMTKSRLKILCWNGNLSR